MSDRVAPLQSQPEVVVARLHSHARVMLLPSIVLVAAAGASAYFGFLLPEPWQRIAVAAGAAVVAILAFLVPLLAWLARTYTITTRRVVLRRGIVTLSRREVLHTRGYDAEVRQGWLQQLLRSGDVHLLAGGGETLVLRDVPRAVMVQRALHDLVEQSVQQAPAWRRE